MCFVLFCFPFVRYLPFVGQVVGGWIFKKLAFVFELASNFIAAHEDIAILELLPEGAIKIINRGFVFCDFVNIIFFVAIFNVAIYIFPLLLRYHHLLPPKPNQALHT